MSVFGVKPPAKHTKPLNWKPGSALASALTAALASGLSKPAEIKDYMLYSPGVPQSVKDHARTDPDFQGKLSDKLYAVRKEAAGKSGPKPAKAKAAAKKKKGSDDDDDDETSESRGGDDDDFLKEETTKNAPVSVVARGTTAAPILFGEGWAIDLPANKYDRHIFLNFRCSQKIAKKALAFVLDKNIGDLPRQFDFLNYEHRDLAFAVQALSPDACRVLEDAYRTVALTYRPPVDKDVRWQAVNGAEYLDPNHYHDDFYELVRFAKEHPALCAALQRDVANFMADPSTGKPAILEKLIEQLGPDAAARLASFYKERKEEGWVKTADEEAAEGADDKPPDVTADQAAESVLPAVDAADDVLPDEGTAQRASSYDEPPKGALPEPDERALPENGPIQGGLANTYLSGEKKKKTPKEVRWLRRRTLDGENFEG